MAKKRQSGSENLAARGLVSVLVPCTAEERQAFRAAAALAGFKSYAEWVRTAASAAAEKILPKNFQKS